MHRYPRCRGSHQLGHALKGTGSNPCATNGRELCVKGGEVASGKMRRQGDLSVVHVPRVPDPPTSSLHGTAACSGAAKEDQTAVSWAQGISLLGTPVARDPCTTRQLNLAW